MIKKYKIYFEDKTYRIINVDKKDDLDSVLHLIGKDENKIIINIIEL